MSHHAPGEEAGKRAVFSSLLSDGNALAPFSCLPRKRHCVIMSLNKKALIILHKKNIQIWQRYKAAYSRCTGITFITIKVIHESAEQYKE